MLAQGAMHTFLPAIGCCRGPADAPGCTSVGCHLAANGPTKKNRDQLSMPECTLQAVIEADEKKSSKRTSGIADEKDGV